MKKFSAFFAILALTTVFAHADSDQSKIEAALKSQGYKQWKSLTLDHGVWEVDDAIDSAGKQFDLRVDASSMAVTSKIAE
jgi:hypothetical protein